MRRPPAVRVPTSPLRRRSPGSSPRPRRGRTEPTREAPATRLVVTLTSVLVVVGALGVSPRPARAAEAPGPAPPAGVPPSTVGRSGAPGPTRYVAPVSAAVVDRFRAPAHDYGPGNRGLEYATVAGEVVRAAADGEVIFAGAVAGALHVTVLHGDGLRTSYSYLARVAVREGQVVHQGQPLGVAGHRLHLGVRHPDGTYLDPATLLAERRTGARLVPGADEGAAVLAAEERDALAALVAGLARAPGAAGHAVAAAAAERLALLDHYRDALDPGRRLAGLAATLARRRGARAGCTPAAHPPPGVAGRRIAVLVAGLGSTSEPTSVDDIDVGALGYAPGDVLRASYRGGRVPDPSDGAAFSAIPARPYGSGHAQGDLRQAAGHLATLLAEVARIAPGTPIDVLAHSQGGVVARLALADPQHPPPAELETLITLGSPHGGADLATAAAALRASWSAGPPVEGEVAAAVGLDHRSAAVGQLSELSDVVADLERTGVPPGVRFLSVAARGDVVVPVPRTVVAGHPHVVVPLVGPTAHSDLPGSAEATREVALALAGAGPTCASWGDDLVDGVAGELLAGLADLHGAQRLAVRALR